MPKLVHQLTEPTDETPQGMHINHAPPEQLTELSRVGIERALEIIRNRPFKSVQSLVRVKGIGPNNRPKSLGEYLKEKQASLSTVTRTLTRARPITSNVPNTSTATGFSRAVTEIGQPKETVRKGTRVTTFDGPRKPIRAEAERLDRLTPEQLKRFNYVDHNIDRMRLSPEDEALRNFVLYGTKPRSVSKSVDIGQASPVNMEAVHGFRPIGRFDNPVGDLLHKFRRYMGWDKRASEKIASSDHYKALLRSILRTTKNTSKKITKEIPELASSSIDLVPNNNDSLLPLIQEELRGRASRAVNTGPYFGSIDIPKIITDVLDARVAKSASELVGMAPKWSDKSHIVAALKQHLNDTQANLGTDKEDKELVDLGLILDAYRQTQMPSYSDLLKDRLAKFKEYADAPSLGKTASESGLVTWVPEGDLDSVRRHGLLSSEAALRNSEVLSTIAKRRGVSLKSLSEEIKNRLNSWHTPSSKGINALFKLPPDKLKIYFEKTATSNINQSNSLFRINLPSLLYGRNHTLTENIEMTSKEDDVQKFKDILKNLSEIDVINEGGELRVDIGKPRPLINALRTFRNRRLPLSTRILSGTQRLVLSPISGTLSTLFGNTFSNNYDLNAHTLTVSGGSVPVFLHELGHAKDFAARIKNHKDNNVGYRGFNSNSQMGSEIRATRYANQWLDEYAKRKGLSKEELEKKRNVLSAALDTYVNIKGIKAPAFDTIEDYHAFRNKLLRQPITKTTPFTSDSETSKRLSDIVKHIDPEVKSYFS